MKLIVKQVKTTHWLDLYDIFDEDNKVVYTVKQELSWGKKFIFYDSNKNEVAYIHEKAISLLPAYEIFIDNKKVGEIKQKMSITKNMYECDFAELEIENDIWSFDYKIKRKGQEIAKITEKAITWTDTYTIEGNEEDIFNILLVVIVIDIDNNKNTNK